MQNRLRLAYLLKGSLLWVLILMLLGAFSEVQATHIRAGDIVAKRDTTPNPNPRRFFFRMVIYTNPASTADDPEVTIFTGVGNTTIVVPRKSVTRIRPDVDREVFEWSYTYPADGTYTTYWIGENRNGGILNMAPPSDQRSFYIETTVNINVLRGFNSTPVLTVAPVDKAAINRRYVHNPGAFDADGDSLAFKLLAPRYSQNGNIQVVPGYTLPANTFQCQTSDASGPAFFRLDVRTGQITWDAPCVKGEYNIAFVVEEWRRGANGSRIKIGEVVRDMQILVEDNENRPPVLEPKDTCIVAGTRLRDIIRATDPDGDLINLTVAGSGIVPPATFRQITNNPGSATGELIWQTSCEDVRREPYQVVFRAEDVRPNNEERLADLQPYNITVVGPPPVLQAPVSSDQNVTITWDQYECQNADKIRIYRREGPSNFEPDDCQTGVPASTGYVLIGEVDAGEVSFFDDNNGQGLEPGKEYCYIIYATFPPVGFGESLASNEVCIVIDQDIPYLTNVDVQQTGETNGSIEVKWTQPMEVQNLTPPLEYRLFRKVGQQAGNGFTEIFRTRNMADTTFTDTGLNTVENGYRYRLEFYRAATPGAAPSVLRDSSEASSVYLTLAPSEGDAKEIGLSWTYDVPWDNTSYRHYIYRAQEGGAFTLIDSVQISAAGSGTYTDQGTFNGQELQRGVEYCYYVDTRGSYDVEGLPQPLVNSSQQVCAALPLEICPPELTLDELNCDLFTQNPEQPPYENVLTWVPQIGGDCTADIAYYTIYYKPTLDSEYAPIDTTTETTYTHSGLDSFAGCYVVTATDVNGRESEFSNEECKDNCISFMLPNIITPNGDNLNDVFRPDNRSVFIKSTSFKVFNRWGNLVYESTNEPYINWPGTDKDGNRLPDGAYFYEAEVEFFSLDPARSRSTYKGWVEVVR